ncbi:hypothetical protein, partial [Pelagibius sp. Alg239-R121]|uniref:hypothetical protein n=1 Tax=Pelagibius sp. Alg239-R121 TaxID=2993448 RepID=UPI0024A65504
TQDLAISNASREVRRVCCRDQLNPPPILGIRRCTRWMLVSDEDTWEQAMALWQFCIELIPEQWIALNQQKITNYYTNDGWDFGDAWRNYDLEIEVIVDGYMPRGKSWSDQMVLWGHDERHDIQLYRDNDQIEGLTIRIDLREDAKAMILTAVSIAQELCCDILVGDERKAIAPSVDELAKAAARSNAARFVRDPYKFVDDSVDRS